MFRLLSAETLEKRATHTSRALANALPCSNFYWKSLYSTVGLKSKDDDTHHHHWRWPHSWWEKVPKATINFPQLFEPEHSRKRKGRVYTIDPSRSPHVYFQNRTSLFRTCSTRWPLLTSGNAASIATPRWQGRKPSVILIASLARNGLPSAEDYQQSRL